MFNRGTYGGGPTVLHDASGNDHVVGTQTTKVDTLTINNGGSGGVGKATAQSSLSVGGTGQGKNNSKGVIEWVKRRLR